MPKIPRLKCGKKCTTCGRGTCSWGAGHSIKTHHSWECGHTWE